MKVEPSSRIDVSVAAELAAWRLLAAGARV
jgi:hypothetical protein